MFYISVDNSTRYGLMSKKNVLLITHAFPPGGTVEVQRVTKFAEHLPAFGWGPYVLTADRDSERSNKNSVAVPDGVKTVHRSSLIKNRVSLARDEGLRWTPAVASAATSMIEAHDIDVVFHTAPVFIPFAAIGWIKQRTGIPYVIDLRDPWTLQSRNGDSIKTRAYNQLSTVLEPFVFDQADEVILNTDVMENMYATKYRRHKEKLHTIYNGFDAQDFESVDSTPSEQYEIIYPGTFRSDMQPFFKAFAEFVDTHPSSRFIHYGTVDNGYGPAVKKIVEILGVSSHVQFRGYTDYQTVIETTSAADIGIAVTRSNDQTHVPAKIYDYIGCNIPILCIDDGTGAARNLLSEFENGYSVHRDDHEAIYGVLQTVLESKPDLTHSDTQRLQYERKSQTEQLHNILKERID